jgi:hypothetical protein
MKKGNKEIEIQHEVGGEHKEGRQGLKVGREIRCIR